MTVPLKGRKVLITREKNQAAVFANNISEQGGIPIVTPLLKINCQNEVDNDRILNQLTGYKWIIFTSANGVHCFFKKINQQRMLELDQCQFAVVGHKTEQVLNEYGIAADFIPSVYNAEVMATEFLATYPLVHSLLLVRGNWSRPTLPEAFIQHGINVDLMEVYETAYHEEIKPLLHEQLKNKIDFITFTSPSTVDAFIAMVDNQIYLKKVCVCIGTTTEQRARQHGFTNTLVPDQFTIEGMIDCMNEYLLMKG